MLDAVDFRAGPMFLSSRRIRLTGGWQVQMGMLGVCQLSSELVNVERVRMLNQYRIAMSSMQGSVWPTNFGINDFHLSSCTVG